MKKLISLILALLMAASLTACGEENQFSNDSTSTNANIEVVESEEDTNSIPTDSEESSSDSAEWKKFLKDYEAWVDEYIAVVKKQKENPTDMTLLTEYTKMLSDVAKWTEKADDIAESIEGTDEALEYSKEVLRIAGKLTEISE